MATPSRIREVAFSLLFQLDAQGPCDVPEPEDDGEVLSAGERAKAEALADGAFEHRKAADAAMERFAPGWPAHRQPAVDRAILRLAYHEMVALGVPAAIAINDAIELSKRYSTERSPAFVNAVLDRVYKEMVGTPDEADAVQLDGACEADSSQRAVLPSETARRAVPPLDAAQRAVPSSDAAQRVVPPGDGA